MSPQLSLGGGDAPPVGGGPLLQETQGPAVPAVGCLHSLCLGHLRLLRLLLLCQNTFVFVSHFALTPPPQQKPVRRRPPRTLQLPKADGEDQEVRLG